MLDEVRHEQRMVDSGDLVDPCRQPVGERIPDPWRSRRGAFGPSEPTHTPKPCATIPVSVARASATTAQAAEMVMPRPATRTATITKRAIEPPSSGTPASANATSTRPRHGRRGRRAAKRVHCERSNVNRTRRILAARVAFGSSHAISAAWAVGVCGPAVNNFGSVGPISSGSAASRLNPPVSRPHSAAATMHAAIGARRRAADVHEPVGASQFARGQAGTRRRW